MRSKILMSLMVIVVVTSLSIGATMAWFTDSETNSANTFTTGTLNIDLNGDTNTIDLGSVSNVAPGDVMAQPSTILIENKGNVDFGWFGKFVFNGDDAMKDLVYIDDMQMEFLSPGGTWETADHFITAGVPSGLYGQYMGSVIDQSKGVVTMRKWMGNNLMNNLGYENMGALKPGYSYRLTFKLGLHYLTDNNYMNKPVNLSYQVDATQLKAGALNNLISGGATHLTWMNDQITAQTTHP